MIKSPCKECEKYNSIFPKCLLNCEILSKIQQFSTIQPENVYPGYDCTNDLMFPISIKTSGPKYFS